MQVLPQELKPAEVWLVLASIGVDTEGPAIMLIRVSEQTKMS